MLRCRIRFVQRLMLLFAALLVALCVVTYYHLLISELDSRTEDMQTRGHEAPKVVYKKKAVKLKASEAWKLWNSWPQSNYLYPEIEFRARAMKSILHHVATAAVTGFGVGYKGTQLKASVQLDGEQLAVFKPRRYDRDTVIDGEPYAGFDMHTAEIVGFYLDGLLGFRLAPPVVGRVLNLEALKSVTDEMLLKTYFTKDGDTCFYGVCYYCKPSEAACANGTLMEGSLTIWLPHHMALRNWRHPYQRTYRSGQNAQWEDNPEYCRNTVMHQSPFNKGPRLLDIMDTSVFDFLMGNADRHHYETFEADGDNGRLLHLDNGKSFRDPSKDELSILAPIQQCCRLRNSTWTRLLSFGGKGHGQLSTGLDELLRSDPLYPVLTSAHLEAVDRRHLIILDTVRKCINDWGESTVIVGDIH